MSRTIPKEILDQIADYRIYRQIWQWAFWILTAVSIVCSAMVAGLQESLKDDRQWLVAMSILAAVSTGLIAGLKPREHAMALKKAERGLKIAADTYALDESKLITFLTEAHAKAKDGVERAEE